VSGFRGADVKGVASYPEGTLNSNMIAIRANKTIPLAAVAFFLNGMGNRQ